MQDISREIELALLTGAPLQITGGTADDRRDTVTSEAPDPIVSVDGRNISDYDELADVLLDRVDGDEDAYEPWWEIEAYLDQHDGTLFVTNFDALDEETARSTAQQFKALYEQTSATIAITSTDDTGALFRANPDLNGRVRTLDISE